MTALIIILAIVAILVLWGISIYNTLIRLRNNREQAFSNIDVQLKLRHDLIPNLVNTVKGYSGHEKDVLTQVTQARAGAMAATTIDDKIKAENLLTQALSGLRVTMEAYPDLKANQNFMQLQGELADIENKLAAARRFFNSATKEYNNAVEIFPNSIVAGMKGFKREMMMEVTEAQRATMSEAPTVNF